MAYSSQLLLIIFTVLNLIFYFNAQYIGVPQMTNNLAVALKHSIELKCKYIGSDASGEFVGWYKGNATIEIPISSEKRGHYVVKNKIEEPKESTLLIKIFVKSDAEVTKWYVKTNKTGYEKPYQCEYGRISLIPSPQGIEGNRKNEKIDSLHASIRRTEGESIQLKCIIEPKSKHRNTILWEFSNDDKSFSDLPDGVTVKDNELNIEKVEKAHRGYYRCKLNDVSFTVLLRVKDRLAALWPFIGIVCVVLVLVIIILIFEKRQKSNKKHVATDDDEQDQANDPLVRTTKLSDNDNKKRAVKA